MKLTVLTLVGLFALQVASNPVEKRKIDNSAVTKHSPSAENGGTDDIDFLVKQYVEKHPGECDKKKCAEFVKINLNEGTGNKFTPSSSRVSEKDVAERMAKMHECLGPSKILPSPEGLEKLQGPPVQNYGNRTAASRG